jgi:predicted nicotinamide N-methyase
MVASSSIDLGVPADRALLVAIAESSDLTEGLRRGARVLDVTCDGGAASIAIARAFPAVSVLAHDEERAAVDRARGAVRAAGVEERVTFERPSSFIRLGTFALAIAAAPHRVRDAFRTLVDVRNALSRDGRMLVVCSPSPPGRSANDLRDLAIATGFYRHREVGVTPLCTVLELQR